MASFMIRSQFKVRWAHRVQAALRSRARRAVGESPVAQVPSTSEWDEAFARVESYLRAHRIESRVLLNRLASDILRDARALAHQHPEETPVTLAIQIAHARIGEWLEHALGEGDWADERFRARGRLAILMAEVPQRCPNLFLTSETLPSETHRRMVSAELQPGPRVKLTRMPSAALDFPLGRLVDEKWETFSRGVFLRTATSWMLLVCGLLAAWFIAR
jgi:hypothetical protein